MSHLLSSTSPVKAMPASPCTLMQTELAECTRDLQVKRASKRAANYAIMEGTLLCKNSFAIGSTCTGNNNSQMSRQQPAQRHLIVACTPSAQRKKKSYLLRSSHHNAAKVNIGITALGLSASGWTVQAVSFEDVGAHHCHFA